MYHNKNTTSLRIKELISILTVLLVFLVYISFMNMLWIQRPVHEVTVKLPKEIRPLSSNVTQTITVHKRVNRIQRTLTITTPSRVKENSLNLLMLIARAIGEFLRLLGSLITSIAYFIALILAGLFGFNPPHVGLELSNRTRVVHEVNLINTIIGLVAFTTIMLTTYTCYLYLVKKRKTKPIRRRYIEVKSAEEDVVKERQRILPIVERIFHEVYMKAKEVLGVEDSITHRELAKIIEKHTKLGDDAWVIALAFEEVKFGKGSVSWISLDYLEKCKDNIIRALESYEHEVQGL